MIQYEATLETLEAIPLPQQTDTYMPVGHADFIRRVREVSQDSGYILANHTATINKDGQIMLAKLTFLNPEDDEMDYQIGLLNSYNKTKAATIGVGSVVRICSNGMLSADFSLVRKHTRYVWEDLDELINSAVEAIQAEHLRNIEARELLKNVEINPTRYSEIVGRMFLEEDIINATQVSLIKKELFNQSSPFGEPHLWTLYNHTTHALKTSHPSNFIEQHVNVHRFLTSLTN
jgi:hypothetical protein